MVKSLNIKGDNFISRVTIYYNGIIENRIVVAVKSYYLISFVFDTKREGRGESSKKSDFKIYLTSGCPWGLTRRWRIFNLQKIKTVIK